MSVRTNYKVLAAQGPDKITEIFYSLNPFNFSQVTLDPILSDVLLKKGETAATLSWEELMSRCQSKLSIVYEMIFPNQTAPVIVKGELEPVDITTASRAGNKKVTLISGLETYRIDLDEFARR